MTFILYHCTHVTLESIEPHKKSVDSNIHVANCPLNRKSIYLNNKYDDQHKIVYSKKKTNMES